MTISLPTAPVASVVARLASSGPAALAFGHLLTAAWRQVLRRHPTLATRLRCLAGHVIRVEPSDFPLGIALRFHSDAQTVELAPVQGSDTATAVIRAPMHLLIGLFEGGHDGDAIFFSRDLAIEGDVEAVVMLRNELDAEAIDLFVDASPLPRGIRITRAGAWFLRAVLAKGIPANAAEPAHERRA
ncbi:MAG: SCP2 sterol-binding domain-containing protein [Proteobacteria bacterium]|nr:SCP2 sterol-binding domain-containing protein [Pseudomonadota bacterium]